MRTQRWSQNFFFATIFWFVAILSLSRAVGSTDWATFLLIQLSNNCQKSSVPGGCGFESRRRNKNGIGLLWRCLENKEPYLFGWLSIHATPLTNLPWFGPNLIILNYPEKEQIPFGRLKNLNAEQRICELSVHPKPVVVLKSLPFEGSKQYILTCEKNTPNKV